jgi:hypothetical protein
MPFTYLIAKHTVIKYLEKKWLQISEETAFKEIVRCNETANLRN